MSRDDFPNWRNTAAGASMWFWLTVRHDSYGWFRCRLPR